MDSEITNRCNAACPLCPRTGINAGGVSDAINNSGFLDISLDNVKNICEHESLSKWSYCGNFGDPLVHPKAFEIFEAVSKKVKRQEISTNGSLRSPQFWKELAKLPGEIETVFALDGLEDTHSLYRVHTDFNKILSNAKTFIDNGGTAVWCMIVFEHNQHQVNEAREMAKKLGFAHFTYKITARHFDNNKVSENKEYKRNTKSEIEVKTISAPSITKFQADVIKNGVVENKITCLAKENTKMYVTPKGEVLPCCHVHPDLYYNDHNPRKAHNKIENNFVSWLHGSNVKYNLNKYDINEIMDSYNNNLSVLEDYWNNRHLTTCNKKCGSNARNINYV